MAISERLLWRLLWQNLGHEVNMVSPQDLRDKAERYKRMADTVTDPQALKALHELMAHYEAVAAELDRDPQSSYNVGST